MRKIHIIYKKLLIAEIILLLASVLVFRSLWLILDMMSWTNHPATLLVMLVVGMGLTIPALRYIIKKGY